MKILRDWNNRVDQETALALTKGLMLTNKEMDAEIQNNYDGIKAALPALTSTHIRYKAGATTAEVWNEGQKKHGYRYI